MTAIRIAQIAPVLVVIDITKARHEVLIVSVASASKILRQQLWNAPL